MPPCSRSVKNAKRKAKRPFRDEAIVICGKSGTLNGLVTRRRRALDAGDTEGGGKKQRVESGEPENEGDEEKEGDPGDAEPDAEKQPPEEDEKTE